MATASWNKQMMVDYLIHLKLLNWHLQIVFCIARQVKQLKILIFLAAILKNVFVKNAQHLQAGIHRIWNQHPEIDQNPLKNIIYVQKQGSSVTPMDGA